MEKSVGDFKLEVRTCKCGCARTWRCMPTSPYPYFSKFECDPKHAMNRRFEFQNPFKYHFLALTPPRLSGPKVGK